MKNYSRYFSNNRGFGTILLVGAIVVVIMLILVIVLTVGRSVTKKEAESISIGWGQWPPADALVELSKDFTKETGVKVTVVQTPWPSFYDAAFGELNAKKAPYDIMIGDSQWLGEGVTKGHYTELTKWINEKEIDQSMTLNCVAGYSEYPKLSKRYWGVPVEGDVTGWVYRKDLFEDPKEKTAFLAKYGYGLAVPQTWYQLKDMAEFFNRPEKGIYGLSMWTSNEKYDGLAMGLQQILYAWGADLGNYNNYRVRGVLDSPEGIEALKFYKELYKYMPPGSEQNYWEETNKDYLSGRVAMMTNYFAFFVGWDDPKINKYSNVTGYFAMPRGPKGRYASLGGQGGSIVAYSKNKEPALNFLKWFAREDVQQKWAELGGFPCNKNVLASDKFLKAQPFNKAFADSIAIMKDFWTVPEYTRLLKVSQDLWHEYLVTNRVTAEETMTKVAKEWENIFEYAGYYKE